MSKITMLEVLKVDTMANRVPCVTQNDQLVMEDHDTSTMSVTDSDNSWTIPEDATNVLSENDSDLGGQQTQQVRISTDVRRLHESSTLQQHSARGVATTPGEECDLSLSNHGLPTINEQGTRSTRRRCRRYTALLGDRPGHRRRSIHDMTKPLKSWLYNHKDNPYPTKNDKLTLAESSEMTLIQVSNWFANARRRLKNTVGNSGLTWKHRFKLYNKPVQENADQLSVASLGSGDTEAVFTTEGEIPALHESPLNTRTLCSPSNNQSQSSALPSTVMREDPHAQCSLQSPPSSHQIEVFTTETAHLHKFKQHILHRYLHDSVQHQRFDFQYGAHPSGARTPSTVRVFNNRDSMGSTGDFEDMSSTSPNSTGSNGNQSIFQDGRSPYDVDFQSMSVGQTSQSGEVMPQTTEGNDTYRMELVAAMVLTNMARAKRHLLPLGMMT